MSEIFFLKFPLENSLGGAELHTLKLAKDFAKADRPVKLLTSDHRLFRLFEKHQLPRRRMFLGWEPTSKWALLLWPLTYLIAKWRLKNLLAQASAGSIFFCQSLTEKLILTPLVLKSKIVWLEHKIPGRWMQLNPLKRLYLKLAKTVQLLTVSNFAKSEFVKLGVPEKNIKVIYPQIFAKSKISNQKSKIFTIGLLSRLDPEKGVLNFLKNILPALKLRPDWQILIGGEGGDAEKIKSIINNYNLKKQIKLLGLINDLDEFFSQVSVFVYPTEVPEAFGIAVLEAMSRGVPVIATDAGALPEMIEDGKTGVLVKLGDQQMILKALKSFQNQSYYQQTAEAAKQKARSFVQKPVVWDFFKTNK